MDMKSLAEELMHENLHADLYEVKFNGGNIEYVITKMEYLERHFHKLMLDLTEGPAKGFSIGKGEKLYWYIIPPYANFNFKCIPFEKDGKLGCIRYVDAEKQVKIHYENV